MASAKGKRGSWFADVLGEKFPCVHSQWLRGLHYVDPGFKIGAESWEKYVEAIKKGTVILTQSLMSDGKRLNRRGYVATFAVANVQITSSGLEFDIVQRLTNLK